MAQLLTLESMDPDRDISIYINSPGGSYTAMTAIYDTMQFVKPRRPDRLPGPGGLGRGGAAGRRRARQAVRPAARPRADPPAVHRGRRPGLGHRDPGQRDPADARGDGGHPRPAHRAHPRAGRVGHRARQDPDRRGRQGVRHHRPGASRRARPSRVLADGCVAPAERHQPDGAAWRYAKGVPRSRSSGVGSVPCQTPSRYRQTQSRRGTTVARIGDGGDLLKCSFCGKSQKQVKKLIAGPGVYICDECIDLCNEIIEEELAGDLRRALRRAAQASRDLPVPRPVRDRPGRRQEEPVGRRLQPLQARPGQRRHTSGTATSSVELAKSNILLLGPDRARARRCSPRRWRGCSTFRSRSPTPPR